MEKPQTPVKGARRGPTRVLLVLGVVVAVAGCATPVSVRRTGARAVLRELTSSVVTTGELSSGTRNVLFSRDLVERLDEDPEAALRALHDIVAAGEARRRDVFALAELSFYHAEKSDRRMHYFAAAIYAWAFLFPKDAADTPNPFDSRFRVACDIYNRAITLAFESEESGKVALRSGIFDLPFGRLEVDFDREQLRWGDRLLTDFVPVAELDVRGLRTRYRWAGIGAPLAAGTVPAEGVAGVDDFIQPWTKAIRTAVLRFDDVEAQLRSPDLHARLELLSLAASQTIDIDGRRAPLENEATAALAYMLAESPVWQQELGGFLKGMGIIDEKSRLAAFSPHIRGRIPLVFVHGTASSSGRWAQMLNELMNDSRIRPNYEVWLFTYNTGNPVAYSAMLLRRALRDAVARLDPDGTDAALRRMVVIGHSQGGLLTKMTAIDSGSKFWDGMSRVPLEKLILTESQRQLVSDTMFVKPVPEVRRVVFLATPQHGSYFAGNFLSHMVARFITLPLDLVHTTTDLLLRNREAFAFASLGHLPTAVDNMTPRSSFIRALASIPIVPGVRAHSIIAVKDDGPVEDGADGVVDYRSAHIDGVDSELVVRSGHSCQDNPNTIEEVRRILRLHLREE